MKLPWWQEAGPASAFTYSPILYMNICRCYHVFGQNAEAITDARDAVGIKGDSVAAREALLHISPFLHLHLSLHHFQQQDHHHVHNVPYLDNESFYSFHLIQCRHRILRPEILYRYNKVIQSIDLTFALLSQLPSHPWLQMQLLHFSEHPHRQPPPPRTVYSVLMLARYYFRQYFLTQGYSHLVVRLSVASLAAAR